MAGVEMAYGAQTQDLRRILGVMSVVVAVAWIAQVWGLGGSTAAGRFVWMIGAAMIAGTGTGLIYASTKQQKTA